MTRFLLVHLSYFAPPTLPVRQTYPYGQVALLEPARKYSIVGALWDAPQRLPATEVHDGSRSGPFPELPCAARFHNSCHFRFAFPSGPPVRRKPAALGGSRCKEQCCFIRGSK